MSRERKVPRRRFREFVNEEGWNEYELADIATVKARIGWQGLTKKEFLNEGDYYLITGTDFDDGLINFSNCHYISKERYYQDINIQAKNGDVLITKDGTIGKVAYIRDMKKPATLNAGVFLVKGKNKNISNLFLYHYLAAPFLLDYAERQATGGTIKHLNQNVLVKFPIPLPRIEEQNRIGKHLQNINELLYSNLRKLEKLKALKKAYLTQMFPSVGECKPKLRFAGFNDEWEQSKFQDNIISIQTGSNLLGSANNSGTPLLKMGNIQRGYFSLEKLEYLDKSIEIEKENIAYYGDFLFNTRNTLELVGKGATWIGASGKYGFNSNIARFKFKGIDTIFFNYLYNTTQIIKQVRARATGTTSVAAIYPASLNSLEYMLPIIKEQKKIGEFLLKMDKIINLYNRKLEKLQNLKKAYLNEMFI